LGLGAEPPKLVVLPEKKHPALMFRVNLAEVSDENSIVLIKKLHVRRAGAAVVFLSLASILTPSTKNCFSACLMMMIYYYKRVFKNSRKSKNRPLMSHHLRNVTMCHSKFLENPRKLKISRNFKS
jgi:hypothetical protein